MSGLSEIVGWVLAGAVVGFVAAALWAALRMAGRGE